MTTPDTPGLGASEPVIAPPPPDEPRAPGGDGPGAGTPYPVAYAVEYPEGLSRWKTGLRILLAIPALILLSIVQQVGYVAMFAGWIAVVLRRKYPDWLFTAHTGFLGFHARNLAYQSLLTDKYPSFESRGSPVRLEFKKPEDGSLSRWRVLLWKAILIPPHVIVLAFLYVAVLVVVILAWFAILFTGRYPRGMFAFVVGVQRWSWRLHSYFASFHDEYPPFSLSEDSRKAENTTTVISGVIGGLLTAGLVALLTVGIVISLRPKVVDVNYARLQNGTPSERVEYANTTREVTVRLEGVTEDPPAFDGLALSGEHVLAFELTVRLSKGEASFIKDNDGELKYELRTGDTESVGPRAIQVDGRYAPRHIEEGDVAEVILVFVVPDGAAPVWLKFTPDFADFAGGGGIRYDFE